VESFNKAVGSLESRVMVTARKFKELDAAQAGVEIDLLTPVERTARKIQAPELLQGQTLIPLGDPMPVGEEK
jgi:DNA recombination protein RmuC